MENTEPQITPVDCNICAELYNKSTRKPVKCVYCEYLSCLKCCKTYILNETDPKCMNCGKEWTLSFIRRNFPNSFITTEFKRHIENVLFDKEKALLPATQPIVEREIEIENIQNSIIAQHEVIIIENQKLRELRHNLYGVLNKRETERREFIRTCPYNNCKGYLSTQWKCNLCNHWTCSECHEVKGETRDAEHTCLPENIESAKIIMNETKPCPKCGIRIFKISGCNQMFCTMCNTAFDWRTGNLETNIHNPHYFEWVARNRGGNVERNPLDIQCGRIIDHYFMDKLWKAIDKVVRITRSSPATTNDKIYKICIALIHLRQAEMASYYIPNTFTNNQHLRVKYMRNTLDEQEFKKQIQRNEKRNKKYRDIYNIFSLLVDASTDIMYRIYDELVNTSVYPTTTLEELNPLREYVNECFRDIAYTYSCKTIYINEKFEVA